MYRVLVPVPGQNILMLRRACVECLVRVRHQHPGISYRDAKGLTGCDLHPKK